MLRSEAEFIGKEVKRIPLLNRNWLDYYPNDIPSSINYPSIPIHAVLESTAQRHPDQPACILFNQSYSYGELYHRSQRLANGLRQLGAGPGKRVGILLPNIPEYVIALHASWMTGSTVLQLSPLSVANELEKLLELTDCKIVIALDLFAPMLATALEEKHVEHLVVASLVGHLAPWKGWLYRLERLRRKGAFRLTEKENVHRFERLLRLQPVGGPVPSFRPEEDIALMVPTGGTTGSPKIVMLTHMNLLSNAFQLRVWSRSQEAEEKFLAVLPFFHAYGLTVCMLSPIALAGTMLLNPRFEVNAVMKILSKHQPSIVPAVPAMLSAMNRELAKHPQDLSFIRGVICGASALDSEVRKEFEQYGVQSVAEGYGLSEASPVTHANPIGEGNRPGTIGLPLPDTEARIMDTETGTVELPVGEVGELVVRGPQVMAGYYNNPSETERALRDGWLHTGDLAFRDQDGYFTIVDRKKDIIKTSGFLVYPTEIEEVLISHPQVAEAAVIGVADEEKGEIVKALLVPSDEEINLSEVEQYCKERLGKHKRPQVFETVPALPKNFLGKILRRQLREQKV